jgi:hypothetical protein
MDQEGEGEAFPPLFPPLSPTLPTLPQALPQLGATTHVSYPYSVDGTGFPLPKLYSRTIPIMMVRDRAYITARDFSTLTGRALSSNSAHQESIPIDNFVGVDGWPKQLRRVMELDAVFRHMRAQRLPTALVQSAQRQLISDRRDGGVHNAAPFIYGGGAAEEPPTEHSGDEVATLPVPQAVVRTAASAEVEAVLRRVEELSAAVIREMRDTLAQCKQLVGEQALALAVEDPAWPGMVRARVDEMAREELAKRRKTDDGDGGE